MNAKTIRRRTMRPALLMLTLAVITGCATASTASRTVMDIDEARAANCQFIANVSESKTIGLLWSTQGVEQAQIKARNSAAQLGATHVVWNPVNSGGLVHTASGRAYRCN